MYLTDGLKIPDGVTVFVHWCAGWWPVQAKGYESLAYDGGLVWNSDELAVVHEDGRQKEANQFARLLVNMKFANVKVFEKLIPGEVNVGSR